MTDSRNVEADRGNLLVVAAMSLFWIGPVVRFWGAAFGPFRPSSYPPADVAPSLPWFVVGLVMCFIPALFPARFYACWEGARGVRVYETLRVRVVKRFATNGDLVNRRARRLDAGHRNVRDAASARAWIGKAREAERNHLVLLLMGLLTTLHAMRIGWYGWAAALAMGNLVFNFYPILLQRYNRCRIQRLLSRPRGLSRPTGDRVPDSSIP